MFNEKHPNKKFWIVRSYYADRVSWPEDEWVDSDIYNKRIKKLAKYNTENESNSYFYELLDYKYNAITPAGEVCVIPVQSYLKVEHEGELLGMESMLVDNFFVRDSISGQWRVLEYGFNFTDQNINEFFPDLPENIKSGLNSGVVEAEVAIDVSTVSE